MNVQPQSAEANRKRIQIFVQTCGISEQALGSVIRNIPGHQTTKDELLRTAHKEEEEKFVGLSF